MIFFYLIVLFSAVPNHPWIGSEAEGQVITLFKILGVIASLYALFYIAARGSFPRFFSTWPVRFFLPLMAIVTASYLGERIQEKMFLGAANPFSTYLGFIMMCFVTQSLVDSVPRLRMSCLMLIGALGLASLYSVREWQVAGFSGRPGWVAGDSNVLAASALLTIPLAYHLYREKGPQWERRFCLACLLLTVLALVLASSRGGFVGASVCLLYLFARSEQKAKFLVLALILIPLIIVSPLSPLKRFLNPEYGDTVSAEAHKALLRAGLRSVVEHPLVGVGLGGFKGLVHRTGALDEVYGVSGVSLMAHNTYLEYAAELGIPALVLFLGVLISTYVLLERIRKRAMELGDTFFKAVARGMQEALIGFCVAAFFISAEYLKPFWILIFLAACMPSLLKEQEVKKGAPARVRQPRNVPKFSSDVSGETVQVGSRRVRGNLGAGAKFGEWNR